MPGGTRRVLVEEFIKVVLIGSSVCATCSCVRGGCGRPGVLVLMVIMVVVPMVIMVVVLMVIMVVSTMVVVVSTMVVVVAVGIIIQLNAVCTAARLSGVGAREPRQRWRLLLLLLLLLS